jgi:hypothetical protein
LPATRGTRPGAVQDPRPQLEEECFDRPWRFNKSDHVYTFGDGGMMFLISGDSSWTHVQGINPDLVIFDEEPPEPSGARCGCAAAAGGHLSKSSDILSSSLKEPADYCWRGLRIPNGWVPMWVSPSP